MRVISQPFNRFKKRDKPLKRSWMKRSTKPIRKVSAKQRGKWKTRKALRIRWWAEGNRTCGICDHGIREFGEMVPDHIEPGSGKSEDESNLQPAHGICNLLKGSRRNFKLTMNPCPCGFRN